MVIFLLVATLATLLTTYVFNGNPYVDMIGKSDTEKAQIVKEFLADFIATDETPFLEDVSNVFNSIVQSDVIMNMISLFMVISVAIVFGKVLIRMSKLKEKGNTDSSADVLRDLFVDLILINLIPSIIIIISNLGLVINMDISTSVKSVVNGYSDAEIMSALNNITNYKSFVFNMFIAKTTGPIVRFFIIMNVAKTAISYSVKSVLVPLFVSTKKGLKSILINLGITILGIGIQIALFSVSKLLMFEGLKNISDLGTYNAYVLGIMTGLLFIPKIVEEAGSRLAR